MSCGSCTSQGCSPAGCKSNGGCSSGGCNKMNTYNWLLDMQEPSFYPSFDIVEVRFKGGRKGYYRNINSLELATGDAVVIVSNNSYHIGYVSLTGELVKLQMKKREVKNDDNIEKIARIASPEELTKFEKAREREGETMYRAREIVRDLNLEMKLSDVEYQADNTKATFYYSADDRIDFRELIKFLAEEFKIRVEMRQISIRHEAGRLGGIGSCGRELCCSTWLSDFKSVNTSAARYQNLSINPTKLSGQCGRLKCCLNYELDTYIEALKDIPTVEKPLLTKQGMARLEKTDIFKKVMWFSFEGQTDWKSIDAKNVQKIIFHNKKGEAVDFDSLSIVIEKVVKETTTEKVNLDSNLSRLDEKHSNAKKKNKNKNKNRNRNRNNNNNK